MQRQQILYDSTKQLKFVVTESVLRTLLCPAQVMRGQLDRLLALIGMNHVEFGVIPLGARMLKILNDRLSLEAEGVVKQRAFEAMQVTAWLPSASTLPEGGTQMTVVPAGMTTGNG